MYKNFQRQKNKKNKFIMSCSKLLCCQKNVVWSIGVKWTIFNSSMIGTQSASTMNLGLKPRYTEHSLSNGVKVGGSKSNF